jgi:two-component system nitrogen regulation sensor histidine kinase NtrY
MVEEFSQFARMPAPVLKQLDARKLLAEQKMLLDPNSQVSLEIHLPEDDAPVYISADAGLMRQVITNLTKNSVENMQDNHVVDPKIELSLQIIDEKAQIEVRDYGSGFPGDDTSRFLEPYVTTREKGTGLGLAIVQKVISDHFGSIRLDNHPEAGAIVTLSMPLLGGSD